MLTEKKNNTFILLIVLLTTFFPSTTIFNFIKMIIALVILFFMPDKKSIYIDKVFILWTLNILVAVAVVGLVEQSFNFSKLTHEFVRIIYYAVLVSLCCSMKISLKSLYICSSVIIIIHFGIQITQYLDLGIVDDFIETYYLAGDADNIHYIQSQNANYAFRSGSIFINPNVYVCYPYLATGVFLQYYKKHGSVIALLMVVVAFFSVVLTGSRMGMVSIVAIIFVFLFINKGFSDFKVQILLITIAILILANLKTVMSLMEDLRAFDLGGNAYSGSLSIKLLGLKGYFRNSNPIYWITGGFGSKAASVAFDFEYAYIFGWFGLFGCYWYYLLIKKIFFSRERKYSILNNITVISILLTAAAATSILNMSVFPYICAIAFPYISDNENKRIL